MYVKLNYENQITDLSLTEKEGYIYADNMMFQNMSLPVACCYKAIVTENEVTGLILMIPERVFVSIQKAVDKLAVESGDAETLVTCYELFGGNL